MPFPFARKSINLEPRFSPFVTRALAICVVLVVLARRRRHHDYPHPLFHLRQGKFLFALASLRSPLTLSFRRSSATNGISISTFYARSIRKAKCSILSTSSATAAAECSLRTLSLSRSFSTTATLACVLVTMAAPGAATTELPHFVLYTIE